MKLLSTLAPPRAPERRGAALLLAFLVLIVIIAISHQITRVTNLDQSVAAKDLVRTQMDLTIESAFLQVGEQLKEDAEAAAAGGMESGASDPLGGQSDPADPGAGGSDSSEAVDSKMDEWAQPASTTINSIDLRVLVQDEDSKYNILNMLAEDEDDAQDAFERVVRTLDACREGTADDLNGTEADEMARAMRSHMLQRGNSRLPRPELLTDLEDNEGLGMPLSMGEFVVLEPFAEHHFRDYFDVDDERVHSIESFLTMWTSPSVGGDPPAAGAGYGVNLNTAPLAVLASLVDSRDLSTRFWDEVIIYRNEQEEDDDKGDDEEDEEPVLDEFGQPILQRQFFDNMEELDEVYDFGDMEPEVKDRVVRLLKTTSDVFSIYITARISTSSLEAGGQIEFDSRREKEEYERSGQFVVRTVRQIVWRRSGEDETELVPLSRWKVLNYAPMEVLDFREDE